MVSKITMYRIFFIDSEKYRWYCIEMLNGSLAYDALNCSLSTTYHTIYNSYFTVIDTNILCFFVENVADNKLIMQGNKKTR